MGTATIPHLVYTQLQEGFSGVEFVDITEEYENLRVSKSEWEIECMEKAVGFTDIAYDVMKDKIAPGIFEYEIAAAGEYVCRSRGANSFAYSTIVGSGKRSNAVVPTAVNKKIEDGEMVNVRNCTSL